LEIKQYTNYIKILNIVIVKKKIINEKINKLNVKKIFNKNLNFLIEILNNICSFNKKQNKLKKN